MGAESIQQKLTGTVLLRQRPLRALWAEHNILSIKSLPLLFPTGALLYPGVGNGTLAFQLFLGYSICNTLSCLLFSFPHSPVTDLGCSPAPGLRFGRHMTSMLGSALGEEWLHFQNQLPSELKQHVTIY